MPHDRRAYTLPALFLFMTTVGVMLAIGRSAATQDRIIPVRNPEIYTIVGLIGGVIIELFACGGYPRRGGARVLGLTTGGITGAACATLAAFGAKFWLFFAGGAGLVIFSLLLRYLRRPEPAEATG